MKFFDEVTIELSSGKGGPGCVSFRREKSAPMGGPNGGDGGRGGSVIFEAGRDRQNLIDYYYQKHYKADNGGPGEGNHRHGKNGEDLILRVPTGTIIYDNETGDMLADLDEDGATLKIAQGGRGGKGNAFFKTSTNRAPRKSQPGEPNESMIVRLELKLLADVGLVGFPNAGKSTIISVISAARPKIADYPFTTLVPNLGVVRADEESSYVVADIPGLIEGASEGAGLGEQFLRHIERTRILWHVLDLSDFTGRDPFDDYRIILGELNNYNAELLKKKVFIVANKMDLPEAEGKLAALREKFDEAGLEVFPISAVAQKGLRLLITRTADALKEIDRHRQEPELTGE